MPRPSSTALPLRAALRGIAPYLDGVGLRWAAGLLSAMLAGLVALAIPQVIQVLVNSVFADVVHNVPPTDAARADVWWAAALLAGLGLAEALFVYLRRFFILPPAADVENRARITLYRRLQRMPAAFHDAWPSGQLLSRAQADLSLLRRWIAFGSVMLVVNAVTILVGMVLLFGLSWQLALLYLAAAVPIMWLSFGFRNDFRSASRLSQDQAGDLATTVEESVHGIRVLKAFGRGAHALEGFRGRAETLRGTEVRKASVLSRFIALIVALPEAVLGLGLALGVWLVAQGELTVGALAAYFATAAVLSGPVESIGQLMGMTLAAKTAIDRHLDVLSAPATVTSPAGADRDEEEALDAGRAAAAARAGRAEASGRPARPARSRSAEAGARTGDGERPGVVLPPSHGALEFRDVRFRFPDAGDGEADELLRGVDLTLVPGETLALVGVTGAGKSTLVQLVPRLYDVTGGAVLVDGVDVRDYPLQELRRRVSIAFEDATLFSDTVRANVLLGAPAETVADGLDSPAARALLDLALDTAQAGFMADLPDGVDAEIGEEGLSLSGGQRQRVALARAIAARPDILVLDDPLSALDVRTEEAVTARLREVLAGTTTLIVAHRPSTVALADRVAVLEDGRVADVGTHAELLRRSAAYRDIISSRPEEQS
ncbi:ABC transporter ATP-binding protein [Micrococcus flavus]|uniref:ATP-binding cassette subfamily B protein n=1 Tax=Micrococcus flavus TaxID=384602 RepID=A0A4Y8X1A8_9MICC|nr:ABC transporter ATP-binding protein [Micrococcus flavus]MBB4882023.1 ATP-binding cassette subfamily B protein [Micrococcus flavus]TFI02866.1 ABC transporter ATP-binding protein [Micrococcus flavus]GGK46817.1 ABC transporter [Micrococcus flavus]